MISTFPPHPAGASDYFDRLARALSNDANVVGLADTDSEQPVDEGKSCYKLLKIWRLNSFTYPYKLFSGIVATDPDIVHINHEYMLYGKPIFAFLFPLLPFLIYLTGLKVIITMHSVVPMDIMDNQFFKQYGGGKRLSFVKKFLFVFVTKAMVACASKVIVLSDYSRQRLVSHYGVKHSKIVVIKHGVLSNVKTVNQQKAKERLALDDKKVILFFGFISRKKGLKYLVSAMPLVLKQHKDALLIIAGGPYPSLIDDYSVCIKELERMLADLHLRDSVFLTKKYIPDDLVPLYFGAADVVVLPHIEVFGASGVLARAMVYAKPVVVTNHLIFTHYIENGVNGVVVRKGDSKELALGIITILSHPSFGLELGRNLRRHATESSWDKLAESHLELYSSLMR